MSKVDQYHAHAQHCMEMAARARHDADKRSWLLLAATWLDMIPERQRTQIEIKKDRSLGIGTAAAAK
jgi:hypothetical protein